MTFGDMMNTMPDQPPDRDMTPGIPPSAPPPPKGILQTSFDGKGGEWGGDDTMQRLRGAFGEGYQGTAYPSETRAGIRSMFTPEQQQEWRQPGEGGWTTGRSAWGPVLNVAGDIIGTGAADVVGAANSVATLGNETLKAMGAPDNLIRDINLGVSAAPFTPELRMTPKMIPRASADLQREMATPPPPSLSELLQRQRAAPSGDPVTDAAISLLRRTQQPTSMPQPPVPFTNAAPPAPTPSGGLLGIPPSPAGAPLPGPAAPAMTADEMLARSQGYYNPADKQAAQGALLHPQAGDAVRSILTDAIPTDPEKAALVGDTPIVQMGKAVQPYMGQPMSFDTAMSYDRQLTGRIQTALRSGDKTMASQLGDAQDALRAKMDTLGPGDTTGDPSALANLSQARQGYAQYVKQSQIEDMQYRASLLPEEKQDAYLRGQAKSMLSGNKTANWTDAERGALETALKSGNIGPLKSFGLSLVKPAVQGTGGAVGGAMFGPGGAFVGGQIGGEMGNTLQARLRAALSRITLDKVSQQLSQGVPPPPPPAP